MTIYNISYEAFDFEKLEMLLMPSQKLGISEGSKKKIVACRNYLDSKLKENKDPIYGISTGFGALYNKNIPQNSLSELQHNLVRSHACGTGERVPDEIVRLMILLKIKGRAMGHSGVQLQTVQRLVDFYNHIIPDLIPLNLVRRKTLVVIPLIEKVSEALSARYFQMMLQVGSLRIVVSKRRIIEVISQRLKK